ncbi:growth hormone secretagogue receptor type 1 [Biomphalaria glabrata]|nr:growth hormone secretagogue receptor type 1 [Biomphalaria glabrata]
MEEGVFGNSTPVVPLDLLLDMPTAKIFLFINQAVLSTMLCSLELVSNMVSIMVFIKQGLRSSVNISFMILSLVDFIKCFFYLWMNISVLNLVFSLYHVFPIFDAYYLISAWPIGLTERITMFITAFVTIERYLSVAAPLHVKKLITYKKTTAVLIVIVISNVFVLIPIYISTSLGWRFYPQHNRTLYGVFFKSNKQEMEDLTFAFHALLELFSLCLIILFNFLLIVQLKRQSNWRLSKSSDVTLKKNVLVNRDAKAKKMIITIATLTSVCHLPIVAFSMTTDFVREFRIYGAYGPLVDVVFSFCFLSSNIYSAAKIFIFYTMSSNFRATFQNLF